MRNGTSKIGCVAAAFGFVWGIQTAVACPRNGSQKHAHPAPAAQGTQAPPESVRALALAAVVGTSRDDESIRHLQEQARANPNEASVWVALGEAWMHKVRATFDSEYYRHADACAAWALALNSKHVGAKNLRGLVMLSEHRFAEARALALEILAAEPSNPVALMVQSDAELELGLHEAALATVQRLVDVKPGLASYSRAAYLRWLHGDNTGARQLMQQAIAAGSPRDPEPRAWAAVQAAHLFWHQGDYAGADAGYDLALRWLPDYPSALVGKARVALARGDARAAVAALERAHDRDPQLETLWLLGDARHRAGDSLGAQRELDKLRHEGHHDARTLALFHATHNAKRADIEEALALASHEYAMRPGLYTRDAYAWVLYKAGRVVAAHDLIKPVAHLGTLDARILFHRGAIALASGQIPAGHELLERALALNPSFDGQGVIEARQLLSGISKDTKNP